MCTGWLSWQSVDCLNQTHRWSVKGCTSVRVLLYSMYKKLLTLVFMVTLKSQKSLKMLMGVILKLFNAIYEIKSKKQFIDIIRFRDRLSGEPSDHLRIYSPSWKKLLQLVFKQCLKMITLYFFKKKPLLTFDIAKISENLIFFEHVWCFKIKKRRIKVKVKKLNIFLYKVCLHPRKDNTLKIRFDIIRI